MLVENREFIKNEIKKLTGIESLDSEVFPFHLLNSDKVNTSTAHVKINPFSPSMYEVKVKVTLKPHGSLSFRHVGFLNLDNPTSVNEFKDTVKKAIGVINAIL